jgi:hypothetical protein
MTLLWLRAFVLTVAVEGAVAVPMLREVEPRLWRRAAVVLFANLASHPAVWFVFPALGAPYTVTTWLSEAWAFAVEAAIFVLVFPDAARTRLVGVSLIANGTSWGAGLLMRTMSHWLG